MSIFALRKEHGLRNEDLQKLLGIGPNTLERLITSSYHGKPLEGRWEQVIYVLTRERAIVPEIRGWAGLPAVAPVIVRRKTGLTQADFGVVMKQGPKEISNAECEVRRGHTVIPSIGFIHSLIYYFPNQTLRHLLDYAEQTAATPEERKQVLRVRQLLTLPPVLSL